MLPVVKMMAAGSLRFSLTHGGVVLSVFLKKRLALLHPGKKPLIATLYLHFGNLGKNTDLARWARGMPSIPSGWASDRHWIMFLRPMPGSIKIVTTPDLNKPKTEATKSMPGGTMSAIRIPGLTPISINPLVIWLLFRSSSAKVMDSYSSDSPAATR